MGRSAQRVAGPEPAEGFREQLANSTDLSEHYPLSDDNCKTGDAVSNAFGARSTTGTATTFRKALGALAAAQRHILGSLRSPSDRGR